MRCQGLGHTGVVDAAAYDAWYDTARGRWIGNRELKVVQGLLGARAGDRILDVGCGTGWFTRRLASDQTLRVTGLDSDAAALAFARSVDGWATYREGDARALPFADASFDRALSITALCFVREWPSTIAEMVRVTRSTIVLGLLHRRGLLWRAKGRAGGSGAYRGAHWHSATEVTAVLRDLGVRNVRVRTAIVLPSGSRLARGVEVIVGDRTPVGSVLVIAGDIPR